MAEALKLRYRDLLRLHSALNSLDGIRTGKEELVVFEFSTNVKWNISKNTVILNRAREEYDHRERHAMKEHGVFDGMDKNSANMMKLAAWNEEMEEHKDREVELLGVLLFSRADLLTRPPGEDRKPRPDNPIPNSVLTGLAPLLKDES